jgi:pantoate--beta-alanine ligase
MNTEQPTMNLINSPQEIQHAIQTEKSQGKTVGFVPTMGALHAGHLSLVHRSISENDITVVSIFVNPTQFGPNEDFDQYPRPLDSDLIQLQHMKHVNYIFTPQTELLYGSDPSTATSVHIPDLSTRYCGQSRPQFFDGICTVVTRLLNCVMPTQAYFGEKDFQQLFLIKKIVADLFIPVKISGCPIIREDNRLALSSRNQYLTIPQKEEACTLYKMLKYGQELYQSGEINTTYIEDKMRQFLEKNTAIKIDYIAFVNEGTLLPVSICTNTTRILAAVYLAKTRLIDNLALSQTP